MRASKHTFWSKLVFLVVIFCFFTAGGNLVFGERADAPVLARVEVEGMLDDLGLPVYAHLSDAAGMEYALVIAPLEQLDRADVPYRILDKHAGKAEYFILSMFAPGKRVQTGGLNNILLDDGNRVIVRSSSREIEMFTAMGLDVQRLDDRPMVLASAPPAPDISVEAALTYDAAVAAMIGQVTQAALDTYVNGLSGEDPVNIGGSPYTIVTRHTASGTPIDKATQYVYEFMEGLGLTVSYHNWSLSGYTGRNVIGELTGTTLPNEIVLITAHLDCMPSGSLAYGADDNGSGSVGVMVSAEILTGYAFNRTVRFVFFTGEEQGILGADVYSDMIYGNGDNVVAVYNMDMLAYDATGGPDLRLHTRYDTNPGYPGDLAIANMFVDVVNTYGLSGVLTPIIDSDNETRSDHSAFWNNGYSAILGIEDHKYDMTPYYHTTSDRVSTLNMTYFTNFVKASVGTAAHLAGPDDGTLIADFSGSPTSGGAPMTVDFTDLSVGATTWSWNFGDTGTSTDRHPSHMYASQGTYTVSLTVTNAVGSDTETKTNYITVTAPQPPIAEFSASSTAVSVGDSVTFTDESLNTPTSWSWTFAGGTPGTSTAQNPTVTYNTPGIFTVTLIAANAQGSDTETKVDYITVTLPPYCSSEGSNYSMEWIERVQVDAMDNSSGAAGYTDFTSVTCYLTGDDTVNVSLTPGFSSTAYTEYWKIWIDYNGDHDFEDAGEEVFSGVGTSTVTGSFTVSGGIDIVTRMRVSMKFNAAPTPCETFSYGEVEDYTVDITSGGGLPPVAEFSGSPTTVNEGGSVTFTDLSTNNPDAWDWTFSGGTPAVSTQQNPTVTYNTAGTYTVTLTATNSFGGDTETKVGYITVEAAPSCPGTITNPGFETGSTSGWTVTGSVSMTSGSHTGSYAVSVDGEASSVEQAVIDLCANTSYTVSCWGKARSTAGVYLGVKNYGGSEQTVQFTDSKNFVQKSITFTTGATNTSATVFFSKSNKKFNGIADDFTIVKN